VNDEGVGVAALAPPTLRSSAAPVTVRRCGSGPSPFVTSISASTRIMALSGMPPPHVPAASQYVKARRVTNEAMGSAPVAGGQDPLVDNTERSNELPDPLWSNRTVYVHLGNRGFSGAISRSRRDAPAATTRLVHRASSTRRSSPRRAFCCASSRSSLMPNEVAAFLTTP